ncbi:oligosaccharide flippase family protein, partial [Candidatus Desantisbacteria bacterium]|nr:oligosaccharide flippase family protein [Candidatus Desantisbacteria bacterium]
EAIVNTLTKILLAFFGIMVIFFGFGVIWVAVCYLVSITIANIISFVILYRKTIKPRFSLDIRFIRDTLLASVPIVLIALFTGIGDKVSTILLGNISGNYGVGLFGSVYKLYEAFFFLSGSIMVVFLPLFSQYYPQQMDNFKRLYRIVFKITISIALPVSGGIIMLSSQIIVLFFGQEYLPAARVLRFLFIAFIFVCMNSSLYYILISIGKQRLVLVGSAITFLINITLCLLLFPSYGY